MSDVNESSTSDEGMLAAQGLEGVSDADLGFEGDTEDGDTNETNDDESKDKASQDDDGDSGDDESKEDDSVDGTSKDDDSGDDGSQDEESKDDKEADDDSASGDEKSAAPKPKAKQPPPKGFVPTAALREARSENSFLKGKMSSLQEQLDSMQTQMDNKNDKIVPEVGEKFEELSEKEYAELVDDNPADALLYMQKLNKFQQVQHAQEKQSDELSRSKANETRILTEATSMMADIAPGLFDEDSTVHDELVGFADTIGFSDDMFYLTNPATQVILPGESEPLFLGDQAASMLKMLVTAKGQLAKTVDVLNDTAQKKLETKIRASVEKELLEKFKTDKDATFRSLQQLSKTKDTKEFGDTVLTDKQFTKLSEKDQERYLSGG